MAARPGPARRTARAGGAAVHRRAPWLARLFERGEKALLGGVPMPWMTEWAGPFPCSRRSAEGARFADVDGHEYVDLCLGRHRGDDGSRAAADGRGRRATAPPAGSR